ncbi:Hypothetical protein SLIV_32582 [Streptomyces lividans TK24]|uniref:Uncharacterized protein n=1 Tax=Streptomyces lividans TK24 TaxID=457428 RepID=A0ABX6TPX0_STRLI|nr:Hypothetical protein SLIV_32582 [Streptomyces lividans TK24]QSJ13010.1 Hypothetical protein SLIVDG2_32582 [Streptomyces lividans]QTD73920.1 Hypothetical protein SLIVYQS_32582 [Streptomyces lividans TK24] [Streptomyces lividans]
MVARGTVGSVPGVWERASGGEDHRAGTSVVMPERVRATTRSYVHPVGTRTRRTRPSHPAPRPGAAPPPTAP